MGMFAGVMFSEPSGVYKWRKTIRDVYYWSGNSVIFRRFHDQQPISSFIQMAWATSNKVGCSIVRCRDDNRYVGVCRYSPRGNVNSNIYQIGAPCSKTPTGVSTCDSTEGLWS
ncbi:hypothetical protein Aduo_013902 [Ancylostoma duodenale]